ncbi:rRNA maturation RNase YbeY [Flavobacteriaceae bacterium GF1]
MAILYNYETDFRRLSELDYSDWVSRIVSSEGYNVGELSFIFCEDNYLHKMNRTYLNHDTLTDIITFDYSTGKTISGDVFISIERVCDNAKRFGVEEEEELQRVMAHGVLHLLGYNDKTEEESVVMRAKENEKMKLFHVEH